MHRLPFTDPSHLPAAAAAVRRARATHGVVALPTETFYGLAVDPNDGTAVERIFAAKGRPADKSLPVVGTSIAQLEELVVFTEHWYGRLAAVWPAPLTVVLPARRAVSAGGATLAVRVPAQPLLRALLSFLGPLTATSANLSGTAPHTSPDAVAAELGLHLAVLLDGGPTPGSPASTLIDLTCRPPRVLRRGAFEIPAEWAVTFV